jgi:hypothetical protein
LSAASYLRTAVKQLGAWLLLGILAPLIVLVIIVTVVILGGHV